MKSTIGIILTAISATAFGTLAMFGYFATANGIDTYTFLLFRFGVSALVMGTLMIFRKEQLPRGQTLYLLIGMGAIGYVGQSFSYLTAIKYASSGLVSLLLYLYPVIVAVLSSLFFHEKITRITAIALGIALLGTTLTVSPGGGQLIGILLAFMAATIYSFYIIVGSHVLQEVTPFQSSTVIFASAGTVYGLLTIINGPNFPTSPAGWWTVAGVIVIATIIPAVAFLAGIQRIGPTNASMISTLEPVVTVIIAAVLFQDKLNPITLIGGGLILFAVILLTRSELRKNK